MYTKLFLTGQLFYLFLMNRVQKKAAIYGLLQFFIL